MKSRSVIKLHQHPNVVFQSFIDAFDELEEETFEDPTDYTNSGTTSYDYLLDLFQLRIWVVILFFGQL